MSTRDLVFILVAVFGSALVALPTALLAAEGLVAWVKSGPRVLPAEHRSREVWFVTDGLDPYRYQTREQVDAANLQRYRRWMRRRAFWRFVARVLGRKTDQRQQSRDIDRS